MSLFLALLLVLLIVFAIIAFYTSYFYIRLKRYLRIKNEVNKMDGPPAWPIFGNIPQVIGTPAQLFTNVRHVIKVYGPTFRCWFGPIPAVCTTCPEDTETVISTTKNIQKGLPYNLLHCWLGTGLLTSAGQKWHKRRKILTPSFHFSILQEFVDVFNKHTKLLVNSLRKNEQGPTDVTPYITEYTLHAILDTAMGTPLSSDEASSVSYKASVKKFGQFIVQRLLNPAFYYDVVFNYFQVENKTVCQYLHTFSWNVITEKSKEYEKRQVKRTSTTHETASRKRRLAMLDVLLSAKYRDDAIDDEGIREEVDTFIFEDKVFEEINEILQDNKEVPTYKDLIDMKYLERCIKESLRLYPSVPMISRVSEGSTLKNGLEIPKDCMVVIPIYDIHRRPDIYPNPKKFDPDRFLPENVKQRHPFAYIPFSAGPRNCIGQRFAMLEMKTVLTAILRNFVLEPVDIPDSIVIITDLVLRTKDGIKVKFIPRE